VVGLENANCTAGGSASIEASGGTGNYLYEWSNGAITLDANELEEGGYSYTVSDENECMVSGEISIAFEDLQAPVVMLQGVELGLDEAGQASLSFEALDAGSSDDCGLIASAVLSETMFSCDDIGTHDVWVYLTDSYGNADSAMTTVTIVDEEAPQIISTAVSLSLDEDGTAFVTPEQLGGESTDNCGIAVMVLDVEQFDCSDLGIHQVNLTVTDVNGNVAQRMVEVEVRDDLLPELQCPEEYTLVACEPIVFYDLPTISDNCGLTTQLELTQGFESGSEFPYGETEVAYKYEDAAGNVANCSFMVEVASPLDLAGAQVIDVSCPGGTDGIISVEVIGGSGAYTFQWDNGATGPELENIAAGTYSVTVNDEQGCEYTTSVEIEDPDAFELESVQVIDVSCPGGSDGVASIAISGGTGEYVYQWDNGATGPNLENIAAGSYSVTVNDEQGCEYSTSVEIADPDAFVVESVEVIDISCPEGSDGMAFIEISGGSGEYAYQWDNGLTSPDLSGAIAGTYTLTVIDEQDWEFATTVEIQAPDPFQLEVEEVVNEMNSEANGAISINISGATPPYTFEWMLGEVVVSTAQNPDGLSAGNYSLQVSDANDCTIQMESVTVENLVGVQDAVLLSALSLSPNPGKGLFNLRLSSGLTKAAQIQILDVNGQILVDELNLPAGQTETRIDISNLSSGLYLLKLVSGDRFAIKKLILDK